MYITSDILSYILAAILLALAFGAIPGPLTRLDTMSF